MLTRRLLLGSGLMFGTIAIVGARPAFARKMSKAEIFNDKDAPLIGNPKGDVTIVEYFDYQCPYCKKTHPTVRKVVERDGNVKLVMKDWPIFGDASIFASQAVLGAAQIGKYEVAHEALMKTKGKFTHEDVEKTLKDAGLSMAEIAGAVNKYNAKISGLLDRNYSQAMEFNFVGTPAYVIGTNVYPGVLDEKGLVEAIARARKA